MSGRLLAVVLLVSCTQSEAAVVAAPAGVGGVGPLGGGFGFDPAAPDLGDDGTWPGAEPDPDPDPDPDAGPEPTADPEPLRRAIAVAAGARHTCALLDDGRVRCFGLGEHGQLGLGQAESIGDDEPIVLSPSVALPTPAVAVAAAAEHSCAVLEDGTTWCWGRGINGRLGAGHELDLGDDELVSDGAPVPVGAPVVQLAASGEHSCVRTDTDALRCWGHGTAGELGYGNLMHIGDDETAAQAGDVAIGRPIVELAAGPFSTCVVDTHGELRCFGYSDHGEIGYPGWVTVGGSETPTQMPAIDVGGSATVLAPGGDHTCVGFDDGSVRCWGLGERGRLGTSSTETIGLHEPPAAAPLVGLDVAVEALAAGRDHTCALSRTGEVFCWGVGEFGRLGYADEHDVGDDERPDDVGPVALPGPAIAISAGYEHTCAILDSEALYCWGAADFGQLGYGSTAAVGDDETPAERGPVPL